MRYLLIKFLTWADDVTYDWRIVEWMNERINRRHPPEVFHDGEWRQDDR